VKIFDLFYLKDVNLIFLIYQSSPAINEALLNILRIVFLGARHFRHEDTYISIIRSLFGDEFEYIPREIIDEMRNFLIMEHRTMIDRFRTNLLHIHEDGSIFNIITTLSHK
jgi:hypothetical protein